MNLTGTKNQVVEREGVDELTRVIFNPLPESFVIDFDYLTRAEGVELPEGVKYVLLFNLTNAKYLVLTDGVELVDLSSLETLEGVTLSNVFGRIYYLGGTYTPLNDALKENKPIYRPL